MHALIKDKKPKALNAFFALLINSQISYPQEDWNGEQNKPPIIQEEVVRVLQYYLDTQESMGPDGIHPRVLRKLAEELAKPLSIIY